MSRQAGLYRTQAAEGSGWRRWALALAFLLTAVVTAIAVAALSATQLTARTTAQQLLSRGVETLLEVDQYVLNAWPRLEEAAAQGDPILLTDFPIALQLDPAGLADGPEAVSHAISAATASVIYDDGLSVLSDSPQAFQLFSQSAAFDGTVGRLTRGGHTIATLALIVSGIFALLLSMATAAQCGGLARVGAPALAIGLGAALVWIAAIVTQSAFEGRASTTLDPFAADLWLIASDALSLVVRNAAIVALAGGIIAGVAAAGGVLLPMSEQTSDSPPPSWR